MKVHLIRKELIEDFVSRNPQQRNSIATWLTTIKNVDWNAVSDVADTFAIFDLLDKDEHHVVFYSVGCKVICKFTFIKGRMHLFIRRIVTQGDLAPT